MTWKSGSHWECSFAAEMNICMSLLSKLWREKRGTNKGKLKEHPRKPKPNVKEEHRKMKEKHKEKPGQCNIKEIVKNVNYKRHWFVCEKNRNRKLKL